MRTLIAAAVLIATPALAAERTAEGAFTVKMTPKGDTLMDMAKSYTGAMTGQGIGPFLGDGKVMVYVALETFDGTVDGKRGSFIMMHRGWQDGAKANHLDVSIAPNSGTGELAGISGNLDIRIDAQGAHFYTLRYTLPPAAK
jgi:hypothetical protein